MAMRADFRYRPAPMAAEQLPGHQRDDGRLIKPIGPLADIALFEQLVLLINDAQLRIAEDERQLYHPMLGIWPAFFDQSLPIPDHQFALD
jgi:hypothetical protein